MQQYEVTLFFGVNGETREDVWSTFIFCKTTLPFVPAEGMQILVHVHDTDVESLLSIEDVHWCIQEQRFHVYFRYPEPCPRDAESFLADCAQCGWQEDPAGKEERLAEQADQECGGEACP